MNVIKYNYMNMETIMVIELQNETTGDVKNIKYGVNYFIMFTAPLFGVTLFKNKFKKSAVIMLIADILLLATVIFGAVFFDIFADFYQNGYNNNINTASPLMQLYYMLDLDYGDVLEFIMTSFLLFFVFISIFAVYIGISTSKWQAGDLLLDGYKIVSKNERIDAMLKKGWGALNSDFINK